MKARMLSLWWLLPRTTRQLKATVQSALGFMIAIGLGVPSMRQLGWISEPLEAQLRLLIMIPFLIAVVAADKMFEHYRQAEVERDVARIVLRAMDAERERERAARPAQDEE